MSGPKKLINAIDGLITQISNSDDFTREEIKNIKKIKDICVHDLSLIAEAKAILCENTERLERKEATLSEFMSKLTEDELKSPLIKKMIDYFVSSHIDIQHKIKNIENVLCAMYPDWETEIKSQNDLVASMGCSSEEDMPPTINRLFSYDCST